MALLRSWAGCFRGCSRGAALRHPASIEQALVAASNIATSDSAQNCHITPKGGGLGAVMPPFNVKVLQRSEIHPPQVQHW